MATVAARRIAGDDAACFAPTEPATKLKLLGIDVAVAGARRGRRAPWSSTTRSPAPTASSCSAPTARSTGLAARRATPARSPRCPGLALAHAPAPANALDLLLGVADAGDAGTVCSCHNVSGTAIREAIREGDLEDVGAIKACTKAGHRLRLVRLAPRPHARRGAPGRRQGGRPRAVRALRPDPPGAVRGRPGHRASARSPSWPAASAPAGGAPCASRRSPRCSPRWRRATCSTGSRPRCRTPTTTSSPTSSGTAPTRSCPGCPAARSPPRGSSPSARSPATSTSTRRSPAASASTCSAPPSTSSRSIWARLIDAGFESGHAYGKAVRTVKSCIGSTWCRYGVQDSVQLAIDLELRYRGLRAPHKIKLAVSGCARECAEAQGKDVGVIATERGWNLYVGGNGGMRPRHADLLAEDLDTESLIARHRPVPHVLRPHRRPPRAHGHLDREARGRHRPRAGGRARGLASASAPTSRPTWPATWRPTSASGRPRWRTPIAWPGSAPSPTPTSRTPTSPTCGCGARGSPR